MEKSNNISFTSKIYFCSPLSVSKKYNKLDRNAIVGEPWSFLDNKYSKDMLGTISINSCASATMADTKGAKMLHLTTFIEENFDYLKNIKEQYAESLKNFQLKSSLIIGSKAPTTPSINPELSIAKTLPEEILYDKKSQNLIDLLKDILSNTKPTIFEGHSGHSTGSSYIYDVKNDTYYINTNLDMFNPKSYVKNWDDLRKAFDNIQISPRDTVDFIP